MENYVFGALYEGLEDINKSKKVNNIVNRAYKRYLNDEKNEIKNLGINYKNDVEKRLLELVCNLTNEYVYRNKIEEKTYKGIESILSNDVKKISENLLLYLEMFLLCSGLYELAYKVREVNNLKKIGRYEKNGKVSVKDVMPLFWAYIEKRDYQKSVEIFDKAGKCARRYLDKEIKFLKSVLKGKLEDKIVSNSSQEDALFGDLVRGKRILVIGPAENGVDIEEYISEHDVIISMIYRGNLEANIQGKTHISYYSNLACRKMDENKEFLADLDMAVFKRVEHDFQKEMIESGNARECHGFKMKKAEIPEEMKVMMLYSYLCAPNLLQVILIDLLLFKPEKITVVNTNLFLAVKRYNSKYKVEGTKQGNKSFRRSFALHNMINMFQLTKLLVDNNLVEVDSVCKSILDNGTLNYVKEMQKLETFK